ncbi:HAD family phosphatase [Solihabitans fulvus]|uniref:HAD family phosphatase n=1 Tax=Solihabitans fulvus TaxID=1892852 RepID=A0A5B2WPF7_9PSEU|nr:HAD family phosphatase [Solihabitans fulvus]
MVIFDCDGTLVDSERIANEVFAALITSEGLPTSFEQCVARYMGRSASSCFAEIERELGHPLRADMAEERTRRLNERLVAELVAVPSMADVLTGLAAEGVPVCVASSSTPEEIAFRLDRTGLTDFFDGKLFSATMVANGKPAPDIFLFAAEKLGARPESCAVVEDSPIGVAAGRAAGMRVVGFADLVAPDTLRAAGADLVVTDAADLPGALGF